MAQTQINNRPTRSWLKISIQVAEEHSEAVAGFLAALSGSGVEIVAAGDSSEKIIAYLAKDGELPEARAALDSFLRHLQGTLAADSLLHVEQEYLLEEDWGKNWKSHFKAARLTSRLAIKPSWESYAVQGPESVIELDPGMAFGTGLHATTRLALELIEECFPLAGRGPREVLDVGTGTGILAMACALLGAGRVVALDNDPDAVQIATENVRHNRLEDLIEVSSADIEDLDGSFGLVIANIIHDTLIELAPVLRRKVAEKGFLILAGILQGEQEKSILCHFQNLGLIPVDIRHREEWVAFRLTPKKEFVSI
jgi:ribosomal protein L11 methyltransferase